MQQSPVAAVSIALAAGVAAFWYYQQSRTSAKQLGREAVDEGWSFSISHLASLEMLPSYPFNASSFVISAIAKLCV